MASGNPNVCSQISQVSLPRKRTLCTRILCDGCLVRNGRAARKREKSKKPWTPQKETPSPRKSEKRKSENSAGETIVLFLSFDPLCVCVFFLNIVFVSETFLHFLNQFLNFCRGRAIREHFDPYHSDTQRHSRMRRSATRKPIQMRTRHSRHSETLKVRVALSVLCGV